MSPPTPDPPHPPLHFSDAQIAQWRRGWKVLLRSRTKKKATDPLNEEQRQRNLQKGREALQRFRDKQHAMVSTAPGLPRRVDAVTAPALLTPPPVRRCQSPATFVCASPEGSFDSLNTSDCAPTQVFCDLRRCAPRRFVGQSQGPQGRRSSRPPRQHNTLRHELRKFHGYG